MKKIILTLAVCFIASTGIYSQISISYFTTEIRVDGYLTLKRNGMLSIILKDNKTYKLTQYDTSLKKVNNWDIARPQFKKVAYADNRYSTDIKYCEARQEVLVLMHIDAENYELHTLSLSSGRESIINWNVPKNTFLSEMSFSKDYIWFMAMNLKSFKYFLYNCPIKTLELTLVPLDVNLGKKFARINSIENLGNDELAIGYAYGSKKKLEFDIAVIKGDGEVINAGLLAKTGFENRHLLVNGYVTRLHQDDYAISGLFDRDGRGFWGNFYGNDYSEQGNGLYFARCAKGKQEYFNKIEFIDFENFYNKYKDGKWYNPYLEALAQVKAGGKPLPWGITMILHKAIETKNGLVFIGEQYLSRTDEFNHLGFEFQAQDTVTPDYVLYDGHGGGGPQYSFNSYKYQEAIAICLNEKGKLINDFSILLELKSKPINLRNLLNISFDSSNLIITQISNTGYNSVKLKLNNLTDTDNLDLTSSDIELFGEDNDLHIGDGIWGYDESSNSIKYIAVISEKKSRKKVEYQYINAKIKKE